MTTNLTNLKHVFTKSLAPADEIALLGVSPDGAVYAETFRAETEEVMRWRLSADGQTVQQLPEDHTHFRQLPPNLAEPQRLPRSHPWNFAGARLRGLREEDRVSALVQPLTIMQKMPLIAHLGVSITPMQLLGIAENRLLSTASLPDGKGVLCRSLRFAYALASVTQDDDGLPYDYDTIPLYVIHAYDPESAELPALEECLGDFAGEKFQHPMDCLYHTGHLIVADGGSVEAAASVRVFNHE